MMCADAARDRCEGARVAGGRAVVLQQPAGGPGIPLARLLWHDLERRSSRAAPGVGSNQSTPLLGVWERINIGVFIAWVVVLAIALLKRGHTQASHASLHTAAQPA